jgi:hypothetical protein
MSGFDGSAALLQASARNQQLPDGPSKELAEANCNICHALLSRVGAGYRPNGWRTVLQMNRPRRLTITSDEIVWSSTIRAAIWVVSIPRPAK